MIGNVPWESEPGKSVLSKSEIKGTGGIGHDYFPTDNEVQSSNFVEINLNVNYASGPSINGFAFQYPTG